MWCGMDNEPKAADSSEVSADSESVRHLKDAIAQGRQWYLALLEAIGLWDKTEEVINGRHYRYLIANEAFDWLLLAERLLQEVRHLVSEDEMADLLFCGKEPLKVKPEQFREIIGEAKYAAYLNFFYGVTVEEALFLAVEEKVRKEQHLYAADSDRIAEMTYQQIYNETGTELLRMFRQERGYPQRKSMELPEAREFTYWLFKYRLQTCDKERVASDTKRGLIELTRQWGLVQRRKTKARAHWIRD